MSRNGISGSDYLNALKEGRLPPPPIVALLGFELAAAEPGHVTFRLKPTEQLYNPMGSVHGGVTATLCDTAMGCAVHSLLSADRIYTTLEFKVNFVRTLTARLSEISCDGKVLHAGTRIATAEARVYDSAGALYAHATATCLLFPLRQEGDAR